MNRYGLFLGVSLFAVACGGSSSGDPTSAAQFVGKWTASPSTSQSIQCGTQGVTVPLWGNITVSTVAGSSGEIVTVGDNGCSLYWICEGNVATIDPKHDTCSVPLPLAGATWQATFTKGTLTLAGNEVALSDNGTAIYAVGGGSENCTFLQSGSFTKGTADGGN